MKCKTAWTLTSCASARTQAQDHQHSLRRWSTAHHFLQRQSASSTHHLSAPTCSPERVPPDPPGDQGYLVHEGYMCHTDFPTRLFVGYLAHRHRVQSQPFPGLPREHPSVCHSFGDHRCHRWFGWTREYASFCSTGSRFCQDHKAQLILQIRMVFEEAEITTRTVADASLL